MSERYITHEIEEAIAATIKELADTGSKITWAVLETRSGYTRAALSRNSTIKDAYDKAKAKNKVIKSEAQQIEDLTSQALSLKAKLSKAESIIEKYDLKFETWLYNATNSHALTLEQLNVPIPPSLKTNKRKKGG